MTDDPGFARFFSVAEARALVPRIRTLLSDLQVKHERMKLIFRALNDVTPAMRHNGHGQMVFEYERDVLELGQTIRDGLDELEEIGVEVKDIARGVVDFPSKRDGRVVELCWQIEEDTVRYWHEIDAGYLGRQPLDE